MVKLASSQHRVIILPTEPSLRGTTFLHQIEHRILGFRRRQNLQRLAVHELCLALQLSRTNTDPSCKTFCFSIFSCYDQSKQVAARTEVVERSAWGIGIVWKSVLVANRFYLSILLGGTGTFIDMSVP